MSYIKIGSINKLQEAINNAPGTKEAILGISKLHTRMIEGLKEKESTKVSKKEDANFKFNPNEIQRIVMER